jgi:thymidylate synthase
LNDGIKDIELWPCGYQAQCRVKNCKAKATTIARSVDAGGRPHNQYELCTVHAGQIAERERAKGWQIVDRRAGR